MSQKNLFHRGPHTFAVPVSLHQLNRERLLKSLRNDSSVPKYSVVLLMGGKTQNNYSADTEPIFRQEQYFHWTFGVQEPDFYGCIDLATSKSYLFAPKLPESYAIWLGNLYTNDDFKNRYAVDKVFNTDQLNDFLTNTLQPEVLLTLKGTNSDSGLMTIEAYFENIDKFKVNNQILHDHMAELRVFKTPQEIDVIRYANKISSEAHIEVMKSIRPGMTEYQLESIFQHYSYYNGGARHVSYTCICGSGQNSAILHYGHAAAPNDKTINDFDMCLFDMGCEYYGYASDITCSFPANGKFTPDQRIIYEAVLEASQTVLAAAKPGVSWKNMHLLAEKVELTQMLNHGLLKGSIDEMMHHRLGYIFMPHGLGHLLGIDVHDVGGYLKHCPQRCSEPGLKQLRTCRVLEKGMVLTIEPGIYFIEAQLEKAKQDANLSKFIVWPQIEKFRSFGGVRIEDNVVITENGNELLTKVPRFIEEIEKVMAEGHKQEVSFPQQKIRK